MGGDKNLLAHADEVMRQLLANAELPDAELPEDAEDYVQVAAFTSEKVTVAADQWGTARLTFVVNGETKWSAMRATDFPGKRLFVVVYGPAEDDD